MNVFEIAHTVIDSILRHRWALVKREDYLGLEPGDLVMFLGDHGTVLSLTSFADSLSPCVLVYWEEQKKIMAHFPFELVTEKMTEE